MYVKVLYPMYILLPLVSSRFPPTMYENMVSRFPQIRISRTMASSLQSSAFSNPASMLMLDEWGDCRMKGSTVQLISTERGLCSWLEADGDTNVLVGTQEHLASKL